MLKFTIGLGDFRARFLIVNHEHVVALVVDFLEQEGRNLTVRLEIHSIFERVIVFDFELVVLFIIELVNFATLASH